MKKYSVTLLFIRDEVDQNGTLVTQSHSYRMKSGLVGATSEEEAFGKYYNLHRDDFPHFNLVDKTTFEIE